jgi:hypothetical protein
MSNPSRPIEIIWDKLLSRDPVQIRKAFSELDPDIQKGVLDHLNKMIVEEGWHPEQRASAQAALQTLADQ